MHVAARADRRVTPARIAVLQANAALKSQEARAHSESHLARQATARAAALVTAARAELRATVDEFRRRTASLSASAAAAADSVAVMAAEAARNRRAVAAAGETAAAAASKLFEGLAASRGAGVAERAAAAAAAAEAEAARGDVEAALASEERTRVSKKKLLSQSLCVLSPCKVPW